MKIRRLRLLSTGRYRIVVHLDETKLLLDGEPDPNYLYRLEWPAKPDGTSHAAYLQQARPELRALCQRVLDAITATEGAALPGEGDPL